MLSARPTLRGGGVAIDTFLVDDGDNVVVVVGGGGDVRSGRIIAGRLIM